MKTLGPCDVWSFVAQSHTPCNRCVRFVTTVARGHATLATKRALPLTWTGLPPAGSHQLAWRTHSITSSARTSSDGGTSRQSALAVLRLMINLKLDRLMDRQIGSIAIALPVLSAREMPTSTPSSSAMNCACGSICKAVLVDGQVYAWIHQLLQPSRR